VLDVIRKLRKLDPKLEVLQVNAKPGFDRATVTANIRMTWRSIPKRVRELLRQSAAAASENEAHQFHEAALDELGHHIRLYFQNIHKAKAELQDVYGVPQPYGRSDLDIPGGRSLRPQYRAMSRDELIRLSRKPRSEVSPGRIDAKPLKASRPSRDTTIRHKVADGKKWTPNLDARPSPEAAVTGSRRRIHVRLEMRVPLDKWAEQEEELRQSVAGAAEN